jgi:phosphonoacetaldehyde dehydrogenase
VRDLVRRPYGSTGGIKDSRLGYKEVAWEAMKSYTNVKTWSQPWG